MSEIALTYCLICKHQTQGKLTRVDGFLDFTCGMCKTVQFWDDDR